MDYQPYCYLIGWSQHNKYYFGVEYKCLKRIVANPQNLWTSYFTSSRAVKEFRLLYGEPDVIKISKKKFITGIDARIYESKVLARLNAASNEKWLNKTNGSVYTYSNKGRKLTNEHKLKISNIHRGKRHTDESYRKQSKSLKLYYLDKPGTFTGKIHSVEARQKNSKGHRPVTHNLYHKDFGYFSGSVYELKQKYPDQKLAGNCIRHVTNNTYSQHKGWTNADNLLSRLY